MILCSPAVTFNAEIPDKTFKNRKFTHLFLSFWIRSVYFHFWFVIYLRIGIILTPKLIRTHDLWDGLCFPLDSALFFIGFDFHWMNDVLESSNEHLSW